MPINIYSLGKNRNLLLNAVNADDVPSLGLSLTESGLKISESMIGEFVLQKSIDKDTNVELFCPEDAKEFEDLLVESKNNVRARVVFLKKTDKLSQEIAIKNSVSIIEIEPPFEGRHAISLLAEIRNAFDAFKKRESSLVQNSFFPQAVMPDAKTSKVKSLLK